MLIKWRTDDWCRKESACYKICTCKAWGIQTGESITLEEALNIWNGKWRVVIQFPETLHSETVVRKYVIRRVAIARDYGHYWALDCGLNQYCSFYYLGQHCGNFAD